MSIFSAFTETIAAAFTAIIALFPHPAHASYGGSLLPICTSTNTTNCQMATDSSGNLPATNGFAPLFSPTGIFQATYKPRTFVAQVTSDTSGNFTVDLTNAAFTAAPYVQVTAVSTGAGNQSAFFATPLTVSATQLTGKVLTPAMVVVGGTSMTAATSAVVVNIYAVGW